MQTKISASILSADSTQLGSEIKRVEQAGVDLIHVDVMDGHFVPNITMGPFIVEGLKRITNVPMDIHFMIENPHKYGDGKSYENNYTRYCEECFVPFFPFCLHFVSFNSKPFAGG